MSATTSDAVTSAGPDLSSQAVAVVRVRAIWLAADGQMFAHCVRCDDAGRADRFPHHGSAVCGRKSKWGWKGHAENGTKRCQKCSKWAERIIQ